LDKNAVHAALKNRLATEALDINVDITGETIVLSGMVDVLQDKHAAERAVRGIAGKLKVENKLTISTDGTVTDDEVQKAVERKLATAKLPVPGVSVHKGRVQLRGSVDTLSQVQRIVERVSEVLAVKEIDASQLHPSTTVRVDDATLRNRIEATLAGITSGPDIDTRVHNGAVQLKGFVESSQDQLALDSLISDIEGVRSLDSQVKIRDQAH